MRRLRALPAAVPLETTGWFPPWPTTKSCCDLSRVRRHQIIEYGLSTRRRELMVGEPLAAFSRRVGVGMPLDADELTRIAALNLGDDTVDHRSRLIPQPSTRGIEHLVGRQLDADHVAVVTHLDTLNRERRQALLQTAVGRDGGGQGLARGERGLARFSIVVFSSRVCASC